MHTLRRALRNVWRRKFRTLLLSLVLALCVAVFVSTVAGVSASEAATETMMEEYGETAQATIEESEQSLLEIYVRNTEGGWDQAPEEPPEGEALHVFSGTLVSRMDEDVIDEISSMDGVAAVVPLLRQSFGEERTEESQFGIKVYMDIEYIINGVPTDSSLDEQYHFLPANMIDGRKLEEGDESAVLIGEELAEDFGVGVGDTITIEGMEFEVVGIYSSSILNERTVYMSLSDAQNLLGLEGKISDLTVHAEDLSTIDSVIADINTRYPNFQVNAYRDQGATHAEYIQHGQESLIARLGTDLAQIQSLGYSITIVAVIIGILLIFGIMFYTVRERTKEIGTLKALGFSNRDVMKQFMFEGLYIGLIGGAIGLAIAVVSASAFSSWLLNPTETLDTSVSVSITLASMLLGLGVAVIAGALGSLYPAWRASRVSPMEALRNE